MGRLDGKIAWVTGAGSGIGEATAVALAREGATVVLSGRRREPLEQVAARIGERAGVLPADVTVAAEVAAVAAAIRERHGRLDVLVANAGMNVVERDWGRLTPASGGGRDRRQPDERVPLRARGPADDARAGRRRPDPHRQPRRPAGQQPERRRPTRPPSTGWWR